MVDLDGKKNKNRRLRGGKLWLVRGVSFLLVAAIVIALLFAFEQFARWYYRDILSTSHGRDYFYYKSYPMFRTERNNLRFRGGDIHIRTDGTYRVIVLGDSLTWGQGIFPYTSRFPELTEQLFEQRYPGTDIEVINLGVPGQNLEEHIHFLSFVLELKPDFVLYQWYVNDMEKRVDVAAFHAQTLIPNDKWHTLLMNRSVTYILLYRAWNQLRTSLGVQQSYTDYLVNKLGNPDSEPSVWADNALHELITTLQGAGISAGIVLFPQCKSSIAEYELAFLHERVLAECEHDGITCLDLRSSYAAFDDNMQELRASSLDGHPSKTAHRIAAEQIVDVFGPIWKEALTQRSKHM